jgi:hypothetical protein
LYSLFSYLAVSFQKLRSAPELTIDFPPENFITSSKSIEIKGEDKPKTKVIYTIKNAPNYVNGIKLFINIHNSIYKR